MPRCCGRFACVSVERGHDPKEFAIVAFGGAGPLHACALAEELGASIVLVPEAAGVLSALGLVASDERRDHVVSVVRPLAEAGELPLEGEASLRYRGQSFELEVPLGDRLAERFHRAHEEQYGYADTGREIELVALRTSEVVPGPSFELTAADAVPRSGAVVGPCLLELPGASCWVPRGWAGSRRRARHATAGAAGMSETTIPVELQVLGSALRAVAEEMGAVLIRAAFSSNIKERRDCSTALFDRAGRMVVQAEHIPVHLGAMPEAVAAVIARGPEPGEVWALNDPYSGGTHLPDITLVSRTMVGFAVSRAHHADVGGMEPASLPAGSRELHQEGLIIPPTRLDDGLVGLIAANSRSPDERRGDLRAQLAAHRLAEERIAELVARRGLERVEEAMDELFAYSERRVRAGLARLPDGRYEAMDVVEAVEGDLEIRVAVTVRGDEVDIDFDGTAAQYDGNLNCPLAVTRAACLFVVRLVTDPDIPACGGAFVPVQRAGARGLPRQRPLPGRGRGRQHRDVEPDHRRRHGSIPRCHRPAGGRRGDDEQHDVRNEHVDLLRDDRRRSGCRAACRRAVGRSRRDVECAQYARRGARAGVPAAGRAVRTATRVGRSRPAKGRRRCRSRDPRARGVPALGAR